VTAPPPRGVRELAERGCARYLAVIRLWTNAWPSSSRSSTTSRDQAVICSRMRSRAERSLRRAIKARGHFPSEQAALRWSLPSDPIAGPDRGRAGTMDDAVEASAQRVRHRDRFRRRTY